MSFVWLIQNPLTPLPALQTVPSRPIAADQALQAVAETPAQVALIDLAEIGLAALTLFRRMQRRWPSMRLVVRGCHETDPATRAALREGAFDLVGLRHTPERTETLLRRACDLPPRLTPRLSEPGSSALAAQLRARSTLATASLAPLLLTGAPGTGKSRTALAVHAMGPRRNGPFVRLDCDQLPGTTGEIELIGKEGLLARDGALRRAAGGTLYLAGFGQSSARLRELVHDCLSTGQFRPIRARQAQDLDIRLIVGIDTDPEATRLVTGFDPKLMLHLSAQHIILPQLRDRAEDVVELAEHRIRQSGRFVGLSQACARHLRSLPWPGNFNQFEAVLEAAMVQHDGPLLEPWMLPDLPPSSALQRRARNASRQTAANPVADHLAGLTLAQIEAIALQAAIARNDGSLQRAAAELGVAPSTLYRKRAVQQGEA